VLYAGVWSVSVNVGITEILCYMQESGQCLEMWELLRYCVVCRSVSVSVNVGITEILCCLQECVSVCK
jgi:hypothetical protein